MNQTCHEWDHGGVREALPLQLVIPELAEERNVLHLKPFPSPEITGQTMPLRASRLKTHSRAGRQMVIL